MSQPRLTRAWLARLIQPDLAPLWTLRPRLAIKLQRPYVCCAWDTPVRFAALIGHYDLLPRILATETRLALYRDCLSVLRFVYPVTGRFCDLQLFYHDKFEKEGELTLALRDINTGLMLAGLTFCLARNQGQRLAIIGGLQAGNDPRVRGLIHDVTKEMHGLRPKALLLWCLQQLTAPWQLAEIQAVGDAHHVYRHWRKRRELAASYDEFWRECDGRELPGGGSWQLPLHPRQRRREELKPSRRKAHELRYAMLDALRPKLLAAFAALTPEADATDALAAGPPNFVISTASSPPSVALPTSLVVTNHSF